MKKFYYIIICCFISFAAISEQIFKYPAIGTLKGDINAFLFTTYNANYSNDLTEELKISKQNKESPFFKDLKKVFNKNEDVYIVLLLKLKPEESIDYKIQIHNKTDEFLYGPFKVIGNADHSINSSVFKVKQSDLDKLGVYSVKTTVKNQSGLEKDILTEFLIK